MAKIVMQDGSEIRGKIGGKVYSRNGAGAYVRKYVKPVNKNSATQQTARNNFASVSGSFRTLSLGERQTFVDMAPFYKRTDSVGNLVQPTASQLFSRINGKLLQNGIINQTTLIKTCPAPVEVPNVQTSGPAVNLTTQLFAPSTVFADGRTEVPADCALVVSVSPAISFGINRVPDSSFKKVYISDAGVDTADAANYTYQDLIDAVGVPSVQPNTTMWVQVVLFNKSTGQESNYNRTALTIIP